MMERLRRLFGIGRTSQKVDDEIEHKRKIWQDELTRLELLAIESRLQRRDWDAGHNNRPQDNMDPGGLNRDTTT